MAPHCVFKFFLRSSRLWGGLECHFSIMLHIESYIWVFRINSGSSKKYTFFPFTVQSIVHGSIR